MKQIINFYIILQLFFLNACESKSNQQTFVNPPKQFYAPKNYFTPKHRTSIEWPPIDSFLPIYGSCNSNLKQEMKQTKITSLQDFWEEAEDIRNSASSIINKAENIECADAIIAAKNAISYCDDCLNSKDKIKAESFLDDANFEVSKAEGYFDDCDNDQENETKENSQ